MDWTIFGKTVRALRKRADLRQQDLADACDLGKSAISELERGKSGASIETMEGIARALDRRLVIEFAEAEEDPLVREVREMAPLLPEEARNAIRGQVESWRLYLGIPARGTQAND